MMRIMKEGITMLTAGPNGHSLQALPQADVADSVHALGDSHMHDKSSDIAATSGTLCCLCGYWVRVEMLLEPKACSNMQPACTRHSFASLHNMHSL